MVILKDLLNRIKYWSKADRIGPDIPFTHYRLYFSKSSKALCQKKFKFFGENSEFRPGAYAVECSNISIGRNVVIRPTSMLFASNSTITIEDNVLIGSGVHIYVSNHEFKDISQPISFQGHSTAKPVVLKEGCWVGANSIILPGVTIGENAVVAAGSVVTKDVLANTVVAGIPCKIIKKL